MHTLRIKKDHLELLVKILNTTNGKLSILDSRVRDRFYMALDKEYKLFFQERKDLYEKFCIRTEDGKPDLTELKQYQFPKESTTELEQEYIKLMSEEAVIQYSSDPESLKHIIENADYCPEVGEVDKIDIILEI